MSDTADREFTILKERLDSITDPDMFHFVTSRMNDVLAASLKYWGQDRFNKELMYKSVAMALERTHPDTPYSWRKEVYDQMRIALDPLENQI